MDGLKETMKKVFSRARSKCPKDYGNGFHTFLTKILAEMEMSCLDATIYEVFTRITSCKDVTSLLLDSAALRPLLALPNETSAHNEEHAVTLRETGNSQFKNRRFEEALKSYNDSILQCRRELSAEGGISACLPISYANRSAVLYHIGDHCGCLKDIDAAIAAAYPANMVYKLHERKVRCLLTMHKYSAAHESITTTKESLSAAHLTEKEKQEFSKLLDSHAHACSIAAETRLDEAAAPAGLSAPGSSSYPSAPQISHGTNDKYAALSAAVDVAENDEYGKYVVCKQKIDVGDVVAVEEPLVAVVNRSCLTTHCYFCLQRFGNAFYPCRRCSVARYCSSECESRSWSSYHRYECYKMLALTGCGHNLGHLSLRATLTFGLVHHTSHASARTTNANQGCAQCPPNYEYVLRQGFPREASSPHFVLTISILAVYLALCTHPDVAELLPSSGKPGESLLHRVAAIIFYHLAAFKARTHDIYETKTSLRDDSRENQATASAVYTVVNFFNHSCDPTCYRHWYGNKLVVRSMRPVSPDEQIFENYGRKYTHNDMSKAERQDWLLELFGFSCKCAACEGDWPNSDVLKSRCEAGDFLPRCVHVTGDVGKNLQCSSCKSRLHSLRKEYNQLAKGPESVRDPNVISTLSSTLSELHKLAVKPHYFFVLCDARLRLCFDFMGNLHTVK